MLLGATYLNMDLKVGFIAHGRDGQSPMDYRYDGMQGELAPSTEYRTTHQNEAVAILAAAQNGTSGVRSRTASTLSVCRHAPLSDLEHRRHSDDQQSSNHHAVPFGHQDGAGAGRGRTTDRIWHRSRACGPPRRNRVARGTESTTRSYHR